VAMTNGSAFLLTCNKGLFGSPTSDSKNIKAGKHKKIK